MDLTVGKYYTLRVFDAEGDADVKEFLDGLERISGHHKLIGKGDISLTRDKYVYLLFRNSKTDEIIEVYESYGSYKTLIFFCDKFTLGYMSSYMDHGDKDFPEFCGSDDNYMDVEITPAEKDDY